MTLPFEKPDPKLRQYTCFVCGRQFAEYDGFREHIIDKHQQGREYVLCPLERCKAPVRDVRAHYKIKHPKEQPPTGCQMKAIIWKDAKDPKGKKKRTVGFHDGDFVSQKNGKKIHFRSGYERDVYQCLERMDNVVKFDAEPFGIPYWFGGEQKKYFPDLLVQFADGHCEVWEVKPASQTAYEVNDAKWTAADKFCEARGWHFEVKTEQGIKLLKQGLL